jgi:hypothetical protein
MRLAEEFADGEWLALSRDAAPARCFEIVGRTTVI